MIRFDIDKDGQISYEEFKAAAKQHFSLLVGSAARATQVALGISPVGARTPKPLDLERFQRDVSTRSGRLPSKQQQRQAPDYPIASPHSYDSSNIGLHLSRATEPEAAANDARSLPITRAEAEAVMTPSSHYDHAKRIPPPPYRGNVVSPTADAQSEVATEQHSAAHGQTAPSITSPEFMEDAFESGSSQPTPVVV